MAARNSFIISKGFRNYFLFTILFAITDQFCSIIDMIMVGNFVSADAFSALDLAIPTETIITGVFMLLTGGAGIISSRLIGDQNFHKASQVLTVSTISSCLIAIVISVLAFIFIDNITGLLCSDPDLHQYLKDYLEIYFIGLPAIAFYTVAILIVNIDGKPQIAFGVVCAGCLGDIVLNIVFMKIMQMGVIGMALATIVSYIIPLLIILPLIGSRKVSFRFTMPGREGFKMFRENIRAGVPYSLPYFAVCVITLIVNSAVLSRLGSDALYIWSAGYQILSIVIVIMDCIGGTILVTMGSMLAGCQDVSGLKILIRNCSAFSAILIGLIVVLVIIFPTATASLFGYDLSGSGMPIGKWISSIILFGIPYSICCIKAYLNQALDRETGSSIQILSLFAIAISALLLCSVFKSEWMFASMPVAGLVFICLDATATGVILHRNRNLSGYFLLPSYGENVLMYQSVPYTKDGLNTALHSLEIFLERCELSPALCININLVCEEMMLSIVEHNVGKDSEYFFDIIILDDNDEVKITIKDAGYPFNPIRQYSDTAADAILAGDDADLSLRLVNRLCQELTYNYMYGQNTIYMSFAKI